MLVIIEESPEDFGKEQKFKTKSKSKRLSIATSYGTLLILYFHLIFFVCLFVVSFATSSLSRSMFHSLICAEDAANGFEIFTNVFFFSKRWKERIGQTTKSFKHMIKTSSTQTIWEMWKDTETIEQSIIN